MIPYLDADETRRRLPYPELTRELDLMLSAIRQGAVRATHRIQLQLPSGGTLLAMPAVDDRLAILKTITVHPRNRLPTPRIRGEVLVMEAATGRRLGVLEGATLTARRTAALSLLAALKLAPNPDGSLLVVGAGVQGRAHVEAFHEGLGVEQVFLSSRSQPRLKELAKWSEGLGLRTQIVANPNDAVSDSPLIVTATTAASPFLHEPLRPDAFVAAVGAFRADMAEIGTAVTQSCRIYVDTLEGARAEAGDLILAGIQWDRVMCLHEVALGASAPRGPILFKSVGHALWDLAAARLALGRD